MSIHISVNFVLIQKDFEAYNRTHCTVMYCHKLCAYSHNFSALTKIYNRKTIWLDLQAVRYILFLLFEGQPRSLIRPGAQVRSPQLLPQLYHESDGHTRRRPLAKMKVPREELMSDILKRLTGESALPVYSNVEKFKRVKDGSFIVAEDFNETVKKRELVNAKERLRVSVSWKLTLPERISLNAGR